MLSPGKGIVDVGERPARPQRWGGRLFQQLNTQPPHPFHPVVLTYSSGRDPRLTEFTTNSGSIYWTIQLVQNSI